MRKLVIFFFVFTATVTIALGQAGSPIGVNASYIGEGFSNFSGGLKTGHTYLGKLDFGMGFKTDDLGMWQNGEFYSRVENTHGGNPSAVFIGDMQVASNIENGDYTYLYELWYKQKINNLTVQAGILDLNADYLVAEAGGLFFNNSFGIHPSASMNMPLSIFPMNALGVHFHYQVNDALSVQTGIWDGDPGNLDRDDYNMQWKLSADEGFLSATELCVNHGLLNEKAGSIKLGMLYHSADFVGINDSLLSEKGNMQFHLIAEQTLINGQGSEKEKLNAFVQLGYAPDYNINLIPFYFGAGLNYKGLLLKDAGDVLGFALAHSQIGNKATGVLFNTQSFETALEVSYAIPLAEKITLQPDLQYIINTGNNETIDNAFIGFLRVIIEH